MSVNMLNIKSTGTFACVLDNGVEIPSTDITHDNIDVRYQNLLQEMIDEMQSQNFQEIHFETNMTRKFVHKVGYNNFVSEHNPESYEVFATIKEWTHRFQEGEQLA